MAPVTTAADGDLIMEIELSALDVTIRRGGNETKCRENPTF